MDLKVEQGTLTRLGTTAESSQSAVSWSAIFCGAVVAASASLILLALGSGVGLASLSPWSERGFSATRFTAAAAVWLIVTQWIASAIGGYLAGRLRTKWVDIHSHEIFLRDTAHGFVTWAVATIIAALVLVSSAGWVMAGSTRVASAPETNTGRNSPTADSYNVDVLFRGMAERSPAVADPRPEAVRIVAHGLAGGTGVPAADRSYLAALVSARTDVSQSEAARRVDTFITNSKSAVDTARKAASAASIATALSMLIGAFIACAAAALGGRERDA